MACVASISLTWSLHFSPFGRAKTGVNFFRNAGNEFIHLIPKWRKIHYSFVSLLIGPSTCCLDPTCRIQIDCEWSLILVMAIVGRARMAIHTRARYFEETQREAPFASCLLEISRARACVLPSPKLETTRNGLLSQSRIQRNIWLK